MRKTYKNLKTTELNKEFVKIRATEKNKMVDRKRKENGNESWE